MITSIFSKRVRKCDWCGDKREDVKRTHYGSSNGYVKLICPACKEAEENLGLMMNGFKIRIDLLDE